LREFLTVLFVHHVFGVPVGPAFVSLSDSLLVLTVRGLRTPQGTSQIIDRYELRRVGDHMTGQPRRNLLEQPVVAVRIVKRSVRAVTAMIGIRTVDPRFVIFFSWMFNEI
jgi:hypothetical protein